MQRVGIGIIGCGNISEAYLKAVGTFPILEVRGLADLNAGTYWNDAEQRVKRVYRELPPRAAIACGKLLAEAFGAPGLYLARLEKRDADAKRAERKRHYDRLQEILDEEQPYTFLYVAYALPIVHKRFHGIDPAPAGIAHNFSEWYVPATMQKYRITDGP